MSRFGHFVAIDWSGAKSRWQKGIAVAVCKAGATAAPTLHEPEGGWSREAILDWLRNDAPANALIGLDLSPGLPFADPGGYFPGWVDSPADAKQLWKLVDEISADDPFLAATSFVNHPEARKHFRHGKGDCGEHFLAGGGRLRLCEQRQRAQRLSPSSCFNLVGAAQVGKSSLTGMRVLHRLDGRYPIWPFDRLPETGTVIVEIYTSLAARAARLPSGLSKIRDGTALDKALGQLESDAHNLLARYTDHATDAILTAAWLRKVADDPQLWNPEGLEAVRHTEGWTFGVPWGTGNATPA